MDRRKVTNDRAHSRWVRTSEYTKPKGRTLYAIYVDGYRYNMSRRKTYIGIVGWCYTDRNKITHVRETREGGCEPCTHRRIQITSSDFLISIRRR